MDQKTKIEMLRRMLLIRHLEYKWAEAYENREINGIPPSIGTGQEAVSVGACMALKPGDFAFTTHRGVGPQVAMGMDPNRILADLCFKATGYNKGKSYHVTSMEHGVLGMGGIVGAQIPVATGMALAFKSKKIKNVAGGRRSKLIGLSKGELEVIHVGKLGSQIRPQFIQEPFFDLAGPFPGNL